MERVTFTREQRGYWSAALPCALEKYGFSFAAGGPDALSDSDLLVAHPIRLIARQRTGVWTGELIEQLGALPGATLVEGSLPAVLAEALGVRDTGAAARDGALQVVSPELRSDGLAFGAIPGGTVGTGTARPIPLEKAERWPHTKAPITEAQARAWRAPGWDVRRLSVIEDETVVLADWFEHGRVQDRSPAIVQRGSLIGCALGLFAFLGQSHTDEPFEGAIHRSWPRTTGVEALLLGLIDRMHTMAGEPRRRVLPWPAGRSWSMHVRHDVDRPLKSREAVGLVEGHGRVGTSATWYWRARHLSGASARHTAGIEAVQVVARSEGHEVALHTEQLWNGAERELALVESVLGHPVAGSSAHGDPTCFRYQGAPNLIWAERETLSYTEMISHAHLLPHRFALLEDDGAVRVSGTVCLPHHASFERTSVEGDTTPEQVVSAAEQIRDAGGLLQVLNHPDINVPALMELLASLPSEGRWDATASEAVAWWRATHVAGATPGGEQPLVEIEIREPDGSTRVESS